MGNVINSYINDFGGQTAGSFKSNNSDPDFNAAYDELNDFLNQKETYYSKKENDETAGHSTKQAKLPPEELRQDFEYLGVPFGAGADECKAAYKKLLKIHHPDRHAGHEGNMKKATEKSAKINAAWDRIEKWRNSGNGA